MDRSDAPHPDSKHRLEALSDGIHAVALTLLALDLKLPVLPEHVDNAALTQVVLALLPKAQTWLVSFWVIAMFWLAQCRLHSLTSRLDKFLTRTDLIQLALITLLPFSTSVIGEHGSLPVASFVYAVNLMLLALLAWARTAHLLSHPELHAHAVTPEAAGAMRTRTWIQTGCTTTAVVLSFFFPGWCMLAMLPMMFAPGAGRL